MILPEGPSHCPYISMDQGFLYFNSEISPSWIILPQLVSAQMSAPAPAEEALLRLLLGH